MLDTLLSYCKGSRSEARLDKRFEPTLQSMRL